MYTYNVCQFGSGTLGPLSRVLRSTEYYSVPLRFSSTITVTLLQLEAAKNLLTGIIVLRTSCPCSESYERGTCQQVTDNVWEGPF